MSAADDRWAYGVAKRAGADLTEAERQYVLAVARGEGRYGLAWATPSEATRAKAAQFGLTGAEGAGSNNWGAVQGSGDAGSFQALDYGWKTDPVTGARVWKAYVAPYRRYSTPETGFRNMARIILGGGPFRKDVGAAEIKAAIARGDLLAAVTAQHANGYFELSPQKYHEAVARHMAALTSATGWSSAFGGGGGGRGGADGAGVIGLVVVAALIAWAWGAHG